MISPSEPVSFPITCNRAPGTRANASVLAESNRLFLIVTAFITWGRCWRDHSLKLGFVLYYQHLLMKRIWCFFYRMREAFSHGSLLGVLLWTPVAPVPCVLGSWLGRPHGASSPLMMGAHSPDLCQGFPVRDSKAAGPGSCKFTISAVFHVLG